MGERKVYVLLTDTGTLFTRMIKLYTKKPYNHASIAFDQNLKEVYSFGRKDPRNPFIGGFVKESVNEGLFRHARCRIYSFTVTDRQFQIMKDFIKNIESKKHLYRYNFIGLFAFILKKQLKREHAYFCSEFVATTLNKAGVVQFNKPLSLISPHDLQQIEHFQLEYQGDLVHHIKPVDYSCNAISI